MITLETRYHVNEKTEKKKHAKCDSLITKKNLASVMRKKSKIIYKERNKRRKTLFILQLEKIQKNHKRIHFYLLREEGKYKTLEEKRIICHLERL